MQNCFPVSAATVLINISLKTIHAGGFRCAPEERGITAYMGLPIGYGFTHDFALCRSAGAVRHFHRLRHAFSVQMVWYLSLTYGQAHRLSSGTPSACLFYTQKIRNGAAHTLFDSFATAPFILFSEEIISGNTSAVFRRADWRASNFPAHRAICQYRQHPVTVPLSGNI